MIYGYLRKSNEEGVNSSFDTQKYKIECYCNLHNLKVDEWFEDICIRLYRVVWSLRKANRLKARDCVERWSQYRWETLTKAQGLDTNQSRTMPHRNPMRGTIAMLGMYINESLKFGFAYDIPTSQIAQGSMEFMLSYCFRVDYTSVTKGFKNPKF